MRESKSNRHKDVMKGAGIGAGAGLLVLAVAAVVVLVWFPGIASSLPVARPSPTRGAAPSASPTAAGTNPTASPMDSSTPSVRVSTPASTPTSTPTPTPVPAPTVITYTVQKDDVLSAVALDYGITVEALKAASGLTSDDIFPGDVLTIPHATGESDSTATGEIDSTRIPTVSGEPIVHVVVSGETLSHIAERYGVSVVAIQSANGLISDDIRTGDRLAIPSSSRVVEQPTQEPETRVWQPSVLQGDLKTGYPLEEETDRFTLHYQPDSIAARDLSTVTEMVMTALVHVEGILDVQLEGRFDTYVASTLFAPPNQALRGRSFSSQRRFFFLYDGSGTPADRLYILTHELTHSTTWNTMGRPASVMLHEGVAVYTGMQLVARESYISLDEFCSAYLHEGLLPSISLSPSFQGHIRDLDHYYAAGSFVQFLIEEYGTGKFATVYHTGDYYGVYGKSLADLEQEWIARIEAVHYSLDFDPVKLVYHVNEVAAAYDRLFTGFTGTDSQMTAYREVDRARIALLEGRLEDAGDHLSRFESVLAGD